MPWVCLGAGSNFLVADEGFDGVVVKLDDTFDFVEGMPSRPGAGARGPVIVAAGAAASLPRLAAATADAGLAGLDFACGIPGSVGGAVAMNAGAYGRSLADVVDEVRVGHRLGRHMASTAGQLDWGYRYCRLPAAGVVTAVRFSSCPGEAATVLGVPSRDSSQTAVGATPGGAHVRQHVQEPRRQGGAGRLIEAAGLKGVAARRRRNIEGTRQLLGEQGRRDNRGCAGLDEPHARGSGDGRSGVVLEPEVRLLGATSRGSRRWSSPGGRPTPMDDRIRDRGAR